MHRRVQGGLPGFHPVRTGTNKGQRSHVRRPAGTAAAECPEGVEPPGEAPVAQIFNIPKSPITAGPQTTHYAARGRKALAFVMGLCPTVQGRGRGQVTTRHRRWPSPQGLHGNCTSESQSHNDLLPPLASHSRPFACALAPRGWKHCCKWCV